MLKCYDMLLAILLLFFMSLKPLEFLDPNVESQSVSVFLTIVSVLDS